MRVVTAPEKLEYGDLFLAGGISNCPDWQEEAVNLLDVIPGVVLNPRRGTDFSEAEAEQQIEWEHEALSTVPKILFWFPKETLCPITLFELGVFSQRSHVEVFVGTHPSYQRRLDVVKQLQLARPEIIVRNTVEDVVKDYINSL
jgi:hypothetical protein